MNKFTKFLAVVLAAGTAVSFAACGSSATSRTATSANWNERITSNDLTENSVWLSHKEVATYALTFTEGSNNTYSVEYVLDGSRTAEYKTEFYAVEYDWNDASIPEEYRVEGKTELVYIYKTTLTVSGKYTLTATGETKEFDDCIENVCLFRSANGNLQPIVSEQTVKSTAPATLAATTISSVYVETDAVYKTYYNYDCTQAIIRTTDNISTAKTEDKTAEIEGYYSVFDTSMLGIAMRSFTVTSGSVYTFDVMIPINGATAVYQASCGDATALNAEDGNDAKIIQALDDAQPDDYIFVGADDDGVKTYRYNAVTLTMVADMPGPSYTYYYANVPNNAFNTARAALLKISSPLYFGLGSLTYTLSSLSYTKI